MERIRKELILRAMDWHEGQGSKIYSICSTALATEYEEEGFQFCRIWNHQIRTLIEEVERNIKDETHDGENPNDDEAYTLGADLRHSIDLLTMEEMYANVTGSIQSASNISGVVRYMVQVIDTLKFEGLGSDEVNQHPFIYLIMDKLASFGTYPQCFSAGPEEGYSYHCERALDCMR